MIARGQALTTAAAELVLVVLLVLLSLLVLTVFLRALEGIGTHLERKHDRPLLFVRAESSTSRALGDVESWRVRLRRAFDALTGRARPSAGELDVKLPPEGNQGARAALGTDDAEARGHDRKRSAVVEIDATRRAAVRDEVPSGDVATDTAPGRQGDSSSVGHVENVGRAVDQGEWR